MTTNYADRAEQIRAAHDRTIEKIRGRFDRHEITAELRDTLMSRNVVDTRERLTQLRDTEKTERATRRQALERRFFAPTGKDGNDPATRAAAFRDARERAAKLSDEHAIADELRSAIRADDSLLQKALFERAHDIAMTTDTGNLPGVLVAYVNQVRPELADDYKELVDHVREDKSLSGRFAREAAYLVSAPTELGKYQDHRIAQVADDPRFSDVA
ncbi:hypothetical protein [Spirillospora sp. CA-128828]|uniref:hypothetical protein n=1 Tax=Spirillospora sp. CA-128828 TaxID=3240033 RepID=UPI003D8BE0E8